MLPRLAEMGNAAAEQRLRQVAAPGDPEPAIAAERPLPLLRNVHLITGRIVDDAGDDLSLALEPNRNREQRNRVQEIRRRIERIDMPGVTLSVPSTRPLSSMTKP